MSQKRQTPVSLLLLLVLAVASLALLQLEGRSLGEGLNQPLRVALGGRLQGPVPSDEIPSVNESLLEENRRLHRLLALQGRLTGTTAVARVMRRDPETWWSTLQIEFASPTLPRGTAMVLTSDGLLGSLDSGSLVSLEKQTYSATVTLLSSPRTRLAVLVGPDRLPFLAVGQGSEQLKLQAATSWGEGALQEGHLVVTSGLGRVFAQDLVVGRVAAGTATAVRATPLEATPPEVLLWWK